MQVSSSQTTVDPDAGRITVREDLRGFGTPTTGLWILLSVLAVVLLFAIRRLFAIGSTQRSSQRRGSTSSSGDGGWWWWIPSLGGGDGDRKVDGSGEPHSHDSDAPGHNGHHSSHSDYNHHADHGVSFDHSDSSSGGFDSGGGGDGGGD